MFRAFVVLILAQAFVLVALLGSGAQADSIAVLNPSFEDGVGGLNLTFADWTDITNGTHYSQNGTSADGACRALLATPEMPSAGGTPNAQISQVLTTNLAANTVYSLTVAIGGNNLTPDGHGNFDQDGGAYDISLYAGGTELVSGSALHYIETTPMTFKDVTITYDPRTSSATPTVGTALEIRLRGIGNAQNPPINTEFWTVYDNVRLNSEAVPEPGTLVLLATGLIGLVCYAWRKRK
jgi:hypothetical protein